MRRTLALACALAAAAACRKPAAPTSGSADYSAPDGSFSARLPGDWKGDDSPAESRKAAFFGPPAGKNAFSNLMGVYYHAAADPAAAARSYVSAQTGRGPGLGRSLSGEAGALDAEYSRSVADLHSGKETTETVRVVAVVVPGGFYSLEHTWPSDQAPDPAFDELVRTFRPAAAR
jgi:hypothetical protein